MTFLGMGLYLTEYIQIFFDLTGNSVLKDPFDCKGVFIIKIFLFNFFRLDTSFLVSGSQDLTLKLWPLPSDLALKKHQLSLRAEVTEKAHDKDINAIVVSPNDKLIATGSQDKTAKV